MVANNNVFWNKFYKLGWNKDKKARDAKTLDEQIPLGQSECNGCVERAHLTIDKELHPYLMASRTFKEIHKVVRWWNYYYNYQRYHVYMEMTDKKTIDRYYTPVSSIKIIKEYYNTNEVVQKD